jgi:hypothetical protein
MAASRKKTDTATARTRNQQGRFVAGNPGGPGRPRRATEHDYLAVLSEHCSLVDWAAIARKAVVDAQQGDGRARDWLSLYLLGKASDAHVPPLSQLDDCRLIDHLLHNDSDDGPLTEEEAAEVLAALGTV